MNKSILQTPLNIENIQLNNRVVIQPMEGCDGESNGGISKLTRRRYLRFAKSGAGLIWFEAVAVCPEGRANPRQLYLTKENLNEFADLIDEIKSKSLRIFGYAPKIFIQLTHSGRQSRPVNVPQPIFVSHNEYLYKNKPLPENAVYATTEYLQSLPKLFASSAELALKAGFDGVDIKCCHGYLFNELLSAYDRDDKYGGKIIENRARLYIDTYKSVQSAVGKYMIVTSRFGVYDGFAFPYGFGVNEKGEEDFSETFFIIDRLCEMGLGILNITIGNPYVNPHVNRPCRNNSPEDGIKGINRIRRITTAIQKKYPDLAVVMSGMTYKGVESIGDAEECLQNERCKLVGFGRMAFAYPDFYADYLKRGRLDENKVCLSCGNCSKMMRAGGVAGCPIRDSEEYLPRYKSLFNQ